MTTQWFHNNWFHNNWLHHTRGAFLMYKKIAWLASKDLRQGWIIIPFSLLLTLLLLNLAKVFGPLGIFGGLLLGLLFAAALSLYYGWIFELVRNRRLTLKDILAFDWGMLLPIINTGFVFWFVFFVFDSLFRGIDIGPLGHLIALFVGVAFNAIPEVILHRRVDGFGALGVSLDFTKENWIEWFIPYILLSTPLVLVDSMMLVTNLLTRNPLLPMWGMMQTWTFDLASGLLNYAPSLLYMDALQLFALVLVNWYMLFRSHLFIELDGTTRRRRAFLAK